MKYITDFVVFELWWLYQDDYSDDDLLEAAYHLAMDDIKKSIAQYNSNCIVGLMLFDGFLYKNNDLFYNWLKRVERSAKNLGIVKLFLMPGQCTEYQHEIDKRNIDFEILHFNWPVQECLNKCNVESFAPWNSSSNKFLFLTGVPSRKNRIGTVAKLYESGLLHKNGVWSFFPPWTNEDKEWCRNYLSRYSDDEYETFIKEAKNDLDSLYIETLKYSTMTPIELIESKVFEKPLWVNPYLIDNSYYQNTSISIVSDGWPDSKTTDFKFFTEKMWKAIISNHPFLISDHPGRFAYAKEIGLKTFDEYLPIPNYGFMEFEEQVDALVINLEYFLNNCEKYAEKIKSDIEHNKRVFYKIQEQNISITNKLKSEYNLIDASYDKYIANGKLATYYRIPKFNEIPKHWE